MRGYVRALSGSAWCAYLEAVLTQPFGATQPLAAVCITEAQRTARAVQTRGPRGYLEIDAPRRLVQTWEADWDAKHATRLTYLLDATPNGTRVTVRHEGFAGRPEACAGHGAGWERVLGWLNGHLRGAGLPQRYFVVKLILPHVGYWTELLRSGHAVAFGPVADTAAPYGLGVVTARDEGELAAMLAKDPAVLANPRPTPRGRADVASEGTRVARSRS